MTRNNRQCVPITISFSFIPSGSTNIDADTQTYTYNIDKWTGYTGQSTIDTTVTITNISIFEVASKTITVNTPEITLYGLKENDYLIGGASIVNQKLPINGDAMSDPHVIFSNYPE